MIFIMVSVMFMPNLSQLLLPLLLISGAKAKVISARKLSPCSINAAHSLSPLPPPFLTLIPASLLV
jgi:hypothetical protein